MLCGLGLWRVIAATGLLLPLDPNEGWNAYHAAAAISGAPLSPGPDRFMVNNYPPLSFYLIGAIGQLIGDMILAGRLVSLAAFAAICGEIYALARRLGCQTLEAVLGAFLFAAALLASTDYVGMDDPQLLAEAIAGLGLLAVLTAPEKTLRAAALFALAFFVKQNVVAMAFASSLWLFWQDRRAGLRLVGFGVLFLSAGLLLFRFVYGISLLSVLASARGYSFSGSARGAVALARLEFRAAGGAGRISRSALARRWGALAAIYAAIAIATGVLFLGGAGGNQNAMSMPTSRSDSAVHFC